MADGVFLDAQDPAAALVPANDIMYIEQPAQTPKSRKISVTALLSAPTAAAAAAQATANAAATATALSNEAAARALIGVTEIYDANVTGNSYARDVGGSGIDATATSAILRISKITAKSWMLQVEMVFPATTIVSTMPMSWTMHASSLAGTGALIDDLRTALLASGPVMFGQASWVIAGPTTRSNSLIVSAETPATHLRFTTSSGYYWDAQTGSPTIAQMGLKATGMVILP